MRALVGLVVEPRNAEWDQATAKPASNHCHQQAQDPRESSFCLFDHSHACLAALRTSLLDRCLWPVHWRLRRNYDLRLNPLPDWNWLAVRAVLLWIWLRLHGNRLTIRPILLLIWLLLHRLWIWLRLSVCGCNGICFYWWLLTYERLFLNRILVFHS